MNTHAVSYRMLAGTHIQTVPCTCCSLDDDDYDDVDDDVHSDLNLTVRTTALHRLKCFLH